MKLHALAGGLAGSLTGGQDTIVALASPPGRGAIAVVRMSGHGAMDIASRVIHPWPLVPRKMTLCRVSNGGRFAEAPGEDVQLLDQALVTAFPAPDSFTGEDVIEISGHGGLYVSALVQSALISCGARLAEPGEFSRRAVLNGKLDILRAEAIGDIIEARSAAMHRTAVRQLDGGLSRRIERLRNDLIAVEALLAYDIDFPEEDDGPVSRDSVAAGVEMLLLSLDELLATIPAGEIIREGAIVVIAGEPNVGKSSLFNALLGQSRAIVTEAPGTTRDAIESFLETANWPLRLVDTAGLRETSDVVERIGIEVSERYLEMAHVVLACGDSRVSIEAAADAISERTAGHVLRVLTKADLAKPGERESSDSIRVSAETGQGLADLLSQVDEALSRTAGAAVSEAPILTRARHIRGIRGARDEVTAFDAAWREGVLPAPVAVVHLRSAAMALESLMGAVSTEDVLDRVFSSFCVGK